MRILEYLTFLSILIPLTGCAAYQSSTEFHRGRGALLGGMPDAAVTHFQQAAAIDGKLTYSQLQEGIWTYVGRAYYDSKKYSEARQTLERAVAVNSEDGFARLYLGLTLARQGSYEAGQKEVLRGLRSLSDSLNYIAYNTLTGFVWDPTRQLRAELVAAHRTVTDAKPDWEKLFGRLENLGIAIEQEIDSAARDETRDLNRRSEGGG